MAVIVRERSMNIAVLQGGRSAEREVSLRSGAQVAAALRGRGHRGEQVDLDRDVWDRLRDGAYDCVFIALHGRRGEDGTVQGMLELLGVPYTGSGVLASALCIDKARTNRLLQAEGFPVPEFEEVEGDDVERLAGRYCLPAVVKPVREGSTIGLTIAHDVDALASGLVLARRYDARVLVQRFVAGTEITVGVLATPELLVLPTLEITYENETYDYDAKYTEGRSHHIIPARVPELARRAVADAAGRAFRALGCEGMARVDFIVDRDCTPWLLEVNTVPGLTALSLLPDAARAAGIQFPELCERLVRHGIERRRRHVGPPVPRRSDRDSGGGSGAPGTSG
ncbi:MAG TPA: D-alanine--D-alanine ligase [Candidatus Eisenbacteria bacterium]|nr:D-alanine--D-alanine ligase [Candidatus Eisenbacteria bacterium]